MHQLFTTSTNNATVTETRLQTHSVSQPLER